MTPLRRITGRSFDRLTTSLGLRPAYRLRHGSIEFTPCPSIKKLRSQPIDQLGPTELTTESVRKWKVSLSLECVAAFNSIAAWDEALSPGSPWLVTLPNTDTWIETTVEGDRLDGQRGHVVITLRERSMNY